MTRFRRRLALALAGAVLVALPSPALAAFSWTYFGDSKDLIGSTGEDEGDTDFRATCKGGGRAEIGIGAQESVGSGKNEAVSVTLASGARNVRIDGHSQNSPNFQMTAGTELRTDADKTHPVFQLLADPGPIKVSGKTLSATWPAAGRAAAAKAFTKACFGD